MKPLVSIIIRTFNEERYLNTCLSKLLSQTFQYSFEIIIVDSGSTDSTLTIAKSFDCKIFRLNSCEFTYGKSLNYGIKNCQGNIIVVLSAHCIPEFDNWLEKLISPIINNQAELSFGTQKAGENSSISAKNLFMDKFSFSSKYMHYPSFNNGNSAFHKSLWHLRNFDETLLAQEDVDFFLWHKNNSSACVYFAQEATVMHYHSDTFRQLFNRFFKEYLVELSLYRDSFIRPIVFVHYLASQFALDMAHALGSRSPLSSLLHIMGFRLTQLVAYVYARLFSRKSLRLD